MTRKPCLRQVSTTQHIDATRGTNTISCSVSTLDTTHCISRQLHTYNYVLIQGVKGGLQHTLPATTSSWVSNPKPGVGVALIFCNNTSTNLVR
jgi:hypothetical protein